LYFLVSGGAPVRRTTITAAPGHAGNDRFSPESRETERGPVADLQVHALAVVHAELVLIHPFRDGNGRGARLLSTLMGVQAGLPPLRFASFRGIEKRRYVAAVRAAFLKDYVPMERVFRLVIERTLRG